MCGEKLKIPCWIAPSVGSPPRVRGKVSERLTRGNYARITPACAGKRPLPSSGDTRARDHPRVCGEKAITLHMRAKVAGSPPRVRGKDVNFQTDYDKRGITPACAGKRTTGMHRDWFAEDHPRVCGEKTSISRPTTTSAGSPPRVRGKGRLVKVYPWRCRITPACAGKRWASCSLPEAVWDHPRVCGEKWNSAWSSIKDWGSPPRVRGKAVELTEHLKKGWITPACAGKRLKRSHSIGHFSYILCLFHSVLHRASVSGGSRAGPCAPPCLPAQNAVPV